MMPSVVTFGDDIDLPADVTTADAPAAADAIVAVGVDGLRACAVERCSSSGERGREGEGRAAAGDPPIVPVGIGGLDGCEGATLADAIRAAVSDRWPTAPHPVIEVESSTGAEGRIAVLDATLVTETPAAISAYEIAANGHRHRLRADGVVVATPAGTAGYARAAGGPRLSPGTDGVAVVPIAPFAMDADRFVAPLGRIAVTVTGDLGADLQVDGDVVSMVGPDGAVTLDRAGTLHVVRPPGSGPGVKPGGGSRADGEQ